MQIYSILQRIGRDNVYRFLPLLEPGAENFLIQRHGKEVDGMKHFVFGAHFNLPFAGFAVGHHILRVNAAYAFEQFFTNRLRYFVVFHFETVCSRYPAAFRMHKMRIKPRNFF